MTDASPAEVSGARPASSRVGGVMQPAGLSWAVFEFARNPYFMLIVTYVFPPYFAQYIVGDPVIGQATVADATGWAGVIGALTAPLLTTSSGQKMGKSASGAVWLNADLLPVYDFWQYWRNTEDADVEKWLKIFTRMPLDEIARREMMTSGPPMISFMRSSLVLGCAIPCLGWSR